MVKRISILAPTRKRPENLYRLYQSIWDTADKPEEIELVVYVDNDDNSYDNIELDNLVKIKGPRIILSDTWNKCWEKAIGEYFMLCGDDIVFKSKGWDTKIKQAIDSHAGKIAYVWGNDHTPEAQRNVFGTHGFVHRNWTDVIGRFTPPYFVGDYVDTWFNDVARMLNVIHYLHEVWTEHMHFSVDKAKLDPTYREGLERKSANPPDKVYESYLPERQAEAEKLRKFINKSLQNESLRN